MDLPVMPPIRPMLAKAVNGIPGGDMAFEPKWDGFRCIVFRDGDEVVLGSRNERPLTRYFPELIEPLKAALPTRAVVDGEIIVRVGDRLGFDALQQRIHPAESRVSRLATETPAEFVAFDVLALADADLMEEPFRDRRALLETMSGAFGGPVHLAPSTLDRERARRWYERFEGAGLDGLIAKPRDGVYVPNKRTQFKVKHTRTVDVAVAGYRMHTDGQGVGSLVVGLHDDDGHLHHCGVTTSFTAQRRRELIEELAPYVLAEVSEHPWSEWMDPAAHAEGTVMPGTPNRWSGQRQQQPWVPLRLALVAEVKYEAMLNGRFRGTTRMVRWRPDRTPESCNFDQIETAPPMGISEVLSA
ncbi:MAG: ATP-dependent DNA ligase [Acidimicrobiaceae bacterium]|nr:ATP-dependent DNA ligase [Acidimicrobiaceae bacterium]MCY3641958.1 ATP-dependent DNA ligase [Acidimicrobiaceae bacterium]MXY10651.1 ATP-dependent DNA ligase [Acidimicrobiaceae bacterium]MXZ64719.1 ATP-dependent DNA ligase [Acidimicrobiaceae bacterium]MYF32174.1 ATP-dependent DNA ligase [Acidimicrobiaceae bacterium]